MNSIIGIISDTHGFLRTEVLARLQDCGIIIHAGDIGSEEVLEELRRCGTVVAVRGNIDHGPWAAALKTVERVSYAGKNLLVVHDIDTLDVDPKAAGVDAVIYGHSHQSSVKYRDNILYLNPGSAGPRRFQLPASMARLAVEGEEMRPEIVELRAMVRVESIK